MSINEQLARASALDKLARIKTGSSKERCLMEASDLRLRARNRQVALNAITVG